LDCLNDTFDVPQDRREVGNHWENLLGLLSCYRIVEIPWCSQRLTPIWVSKAIWVAVRISVSIELPHRLVIRRHRVHRQEPAQLRIHVPLLHVAEPRGRMAHMPRISRSIRDLSAHNSAIGLIVVAFDHVAIGIRFGNDRTECIGMDIGDGLSACRWHKGHADQ